MTDSTQPGGPAGKPTDPSARAPQPKAVPHGHGSGAGGEGVHPPHPGEEIKGKYFYILTLGALGVVYGDIGTSPLYALKECFFGPHAVEPSRANVRALSDLGWRPGRD